MCWSSPGSHTGCEPHVFHTAALYYHPLHQKSHQCCACFTAPAKAPADALALPSPPLITHPQQVGSGPKNSSQTLPNCTFWMVSAQNQESNKIFLKTGPVSFKLCYKLQQSLGFYFLVKLETTCVPHGLSFCCEYLTQLYGNSLFLWAFSISYPSQNHKKQTLENMKTTIMWKKGGLNFLNLRRRLCSFRAQSEVLN